MKRFLLPSLICPACLPREEGLKVTVDREADDDIVTGGLACPRCRRRFPIKEGIAHLLPEADSLPSGGQWRYEETGMVERYLWSHFADLAGIEANRRANHAWGDLLAATDGAALDAGCAVGRLTFELANRSRWAVGCDLSLNFVKAARRLARERTATFTLPLEGNLRETFHVPLPASWRSDNLEFIVADALRLPFARGSFNQAVSLNLLDRVAYPLGHLYEINRVCTATRARLLLATPFSWATSAAPEEMWLGGKLSGEFHGRGEENVRKLLEGERGLLAPPWRIATDGSVEWLMRTHRNHRELIDSRYFVATR